MIISDNGSTITLAELAFRICNSFECGSCYNGKCPASKFCKSGHNGMLDWLREVLKDERE